jgi:Fe-S oxidoreductase
MDKIDENIIKDFAELFNKEIGYLEDEGYNGAAMANKRLRDSALKKLKYYINILNEKNKG